MEGLIREGTLGDILFRSRIISKEDIQSALAEQQTAGCRFGEALVNLGIVTQEDIDWALSSQLDIPYVRLKKTMIDPAAAELVPAALARQHNLMPLIRGGDDLSVALADPLNRAGIEAVEQETGCQVRVSVALLREIREMQELFYGPRVEPVSFGFTSDAFSSRILEVINSDASGGKFLDYLLAYFIQNRLSGLSLQPRGDTITLLARRGGVSKEIGQLAVTRYQEFLVHLRSLCQLPSHAEAGSRGTYAFTFKGHRSIFQVLMLRGQGGDFVTFKFDCAAAFPDSLADLELSGEKTTAVKNLTAGNGLVVVVHRDAEQRRQLLNLVLAETATEGKSVIIIGEEAGNGSARFPRIPCRSGLHGDCHILVTAALDHDPDILVVEDATEPQSFITASRAAMHGKLVLVGLDFRDMAGTLRHLLYFWHKHYVIPTYIRGIVSCRRVALLCPSCRQPHQLSPQETAALGAYLPAGTPFRAAGCPECDQTGYRGSRYLLDLILFDPGLVEVFETATDGREILSFLAVRGYSGSSEEGAELFRAGDISPEEYVTSILL